MKIIYDIDKDILKDLENIERDNNISIKSEIEKSLEKGFLKEKICKNVYVSVIIVGDDSIRTINRENRGIDKETDVLSFPGYDENLEDIFKEKKYPVMLGDIVLNIQKIYRQSKEYNTGIRREIRYMTVHSFYHLLGYDHMNEEDKKEMREKEEALLKEI